MSLFSCWCQLALKATAVYTWLTAIEHHSLVILYLRNDFFLSHLFTYLNRACHHCSSLKTSLTKWKPDFDSAASEYAKAGNQWRRRVLRSNRRPSTYYYLLCDCLRLLIAVCFKNAKQFEQAKDAYLKEAEYHTENKTYPITWPV